MAEPASRTVLVTGGTGFLGRRLVAELVRQGATVRVLTRQLGPGAARQAAGAIPVAGDLTRDEGLAEACAGVDTLFHLASYHGPEQADDHHAVTGRGTERLLAAAQDQGVSRFVFASSVKAMGEGSDHCRSEDAPAAPVTTYGRAKRHAECRVLEAGERGDLHTSVLRLPALYGLDERSSVWRMMAAIDRGRFPPPPAVANRRSLLCVDDAVRALRLVADHAGAHGRVYIVTDGEPYSSRRLYEEIARALGRAPRRHGWPVAAFRLAAALGDAGRRLGVRNVPFDSEGLQRLLGSACYDGSRITRELGYRPRWTLPQALPEMVAAYRGRSGDAHPPSSSLDTAGGGE